jgi:hypothetical protein
MMSIGLHLRMIGRPGRISAVDRILENGGGKVSHGSGGIVPLPAE